MNEAGLVIDEMQWIQHQMDNAATVDEVLRTDSKIRIVSHFGQSHYFVCDKTGKVATIEWIGGQNGEAVSRPGWRYRR